MTELYTGNELKAERKRKKTWLIVWWVITGIVLAANIGLFVFFCLQRYQWSGRTGLFWIQISTMAVWGCVSFAFFSLKYRRLRAYCKMLKNMQAGLKEIYTGEYIGTSLNVEVKEGVEFYVILVMEYNSIKGNYFERKVLLDKEKDIPDFQEGQILHFVTQANMLLSYEVLERPAGEPTMEQKRKLMATKDKERLFDNVILDEEGLKNLKRKKKKGARPHSDPPPVSGGEGESKEGPDPDQTSGSDEEEKK